MNLELTSLDEYLEEVINNTECRDFTQAYLIDLFLRHVKKSTDLSKQSLTLLYKKAIDSGHFQTFQAIGDWLIFTKSLFPDSLVGASIEYYETLARSAYYKCYLLLEKRWTIYEELADEFPQLTEKIYQSFQSFNQGPGLWGSV